MLLQRRSKRRNLLRNPSFFVSAGALVAGVTAPQAKAQIITDGSLGAAQSLSGPKFQIPADLGKRFGSNLFHSFQDFQLHQGESATFSGPDSIKNVLSRVTGGRSSLVDGQLSCDIPGANLFFLNPAGVVFGPNAQVSVGGDFTATTASSIKLSDGTVFQTQNPLQNVLSSASPVSFGFLAPRPGSIQIKGGFLTSSPGQTISLIGGDITLQSGQVAPVQGSVNLISVGSSGEVKNAGAGQTPDVSGFSHLGEINLSNGAGVFGFGSGQVSIRAQNLNLTGQDTSIAQENGIFAPGKGIDILVKGSLFLRDGAFIQSRAFGVAQGAPIRIQAKNIELRSGGQILSLSEKSGSGGAIHLWAKEVRLLGGATIGSSAQGEGTGGAIAVDADAVLLDGRGSHLDTSISAATSKKSGGGQSGSIVLHTKDLRVLDGSEISSETSGSGASGDITVQANSVWLDGKGNDERTGLSAGSGAPRITGDGGNISVQSKTLEVRNGAVIATDTDGSGAGGDIEIQAQTVRVDGQSREGTGISAVTFDRRAAGNAGNITIRSNSLEVLEGGIVTTTTFGGGAGGDITIRAGSVRLDGKGSSADTSITAETGDTATGRGGSIDVKSQSLQLRSGSEISTSTYGQGAGGGVSIDAPTVLLDGSGNSKFTGLNATSFRFSGGGPGGNIGLHSQNLQIVNGASISADTLGNGKAGDISIQATKVLINGGGSAAFTGVSGSTNDAGNGGQGGIIQLDGQKLEILNGGGISTDTQGSGVGGDIIVNADTMVLDGQNNPNATGLTAGSALPKGGGQGGNISIHARNVEIRNLASLSTASEGTGRGGDISIQAQNIHLAEGGISAASRGAGDAGTVNLKADQDITLDGASFIETAAPNANGETLKVIAGHDLTVTDSSIDSYAGTDGGGIQLSAGRRLFFRNGKLQAQAGGRGGNIDIDAPFSILDRSQFEADAIKENGGNIQIRSRVFLSSIESIISASSQFGVAGSIAINAPNTNVSGSLVDLPTNPLDAESYLAERCAVRGSGGSSFNVNPQNGVPLSPGDLQPSPASH